MTTAPTSALSLVETPAAAGDFELQRLLKVVSDERRFAILQLLRSGEHCVCELVDHLGLSQPLASHHLRVLERAGLIRCRNDGRWAYYAIDRDALVRLQLALAASFDPAAVRDRDVACDVACDERGAPSPTATTAPRGRAQPSD